MTPAEFDSRQSRNDGANQALRMQRYFIAAGTSLMVIVLLFGCYLAGVLSKVVFAQGSVIILFWVAFFYVMFRKGFNLKWRDPSLTMPQMAASTLTILYIMYAADVAHVVFPVILVVIFLFGVLRLTTRSLLMFSTSVVFGYLVVIALLWVGKHDRPRAHLELLQWFALAITLPWFALMGGYISALRERLHKSNLELQTALQTARRSESNLEEAQRIAQIGSWTFEPRSGAITWSPELYRIYGLDPNGPAPSGDAFLRFVHEEDQQSYIHHVRNAAVGGQTFDWQFRVVLPTGETRWVHARGQPVVSSGGETVLSRGTVMDITDRKLAEEKIRQLAHFDSLTGLPNRNLFNQLLGQLQAKAQRRKASMAVLFIDLDGFKKINDTFGHDAGDALLAAFGQRLRESLRKSDTAARLAGDEFVVLIDDFSTSMGIVKVAERILAIATRPVAVGGQEVQLSASIGISIFPRDAKDPDGLIKSADSAMYQAKQAGRNCFRFSSPPDDLSLE